MRRIAAAILVGTALAVIVTGVASARLHLTQFPTIFHVEYAAEAGGGTFSGELISVKRKCNPNRRVVVTTVGPDGRETIGRGVSNSQGHFEFPALAKPRGPVEAEALEKQIPPKTPYVKRLCLLGKAQVLVP